MTDSLKIPVAINKDDQPVHPFEWKEESGPYICPECKKHVLYRHESSRSHETAGIVQVTAHFAHRSDEPTFCGGGTGESATHALAKMFVARYLNEAMACKREWPRYESWCVSCGTRSLFAVHRPSRLVETEFPRSGPFRFDVGCEKFGIEVFHKHRVGRAKELALLDAGIWWVELRAQPLIVHPERWVSARHHGSEDCFKCLSSQLAAVRSDLNRAREASEQLAARHVEIDEAGRQLSNLRFKIGRTEAESLARLEKDTREAQLDLNRTHQEIERVKSAAQLDLERARQELDLVRAETLSQRAERERILVETQEAKEAQRRCLTFLGKTFRSYAEMSAYMDRLDRSGK